MVVTVGDGIGKAFKRDGPTRRVIVGVGRLSFAYQVNRNCSVDKV